MPRLVRPDALVRDSFLKAARDLRDESWLPEFPVDQVAAGFDGHVQRVLEDKHGWAVPISTMWYIDGVTYLGTVIIRHRLTPELTRRGGHIGYHIAPRHRLGSCPGSRSWGWPARGTGCSPGSCPGG